ncbi:TerB family tellurite resistance protein [Streptomyces sp. TRM43335]|uniref:TerB family tellurite resistance protein n=1 Tax=Streptomyces taklimakanensis TaxID=2569853 RepID=A0A6G2B9P6_9ACTN|nr:TerB family tellurite resistance protein [Streptomyces taklimakanensis]MTE18978.1 TerB family tellurite resistance protein [Streptomyces taklimakanensis]
MALKRDGGTAVVHSRSRDGRRLRVAGVRTAWRTIDDGEFFCPSCGGDRNYRRRTGRRRLVVLGVPVLARGDTGPVLECASCRGHFGVDALDHPTTTKLGAMLRDAVHTVALAMLAAGGSESRSAREAAVDSVRAAGFAGCSEEQLITLLAAVGGDSVTMEIELHEALAPLAPHLAAPGRESLLLQGARVALADGPYTPAEHRALLSVGRALRLDRRDTERLLETARTTPS